ncbi:MAG: hypothetical protein IH607_02470, partial [Firmicutes bacterium]|nr:hypothetical protein [Bacillota bacterium]
MAYYSKVSDPKTRDQKRRSAEQRGGFNDEGTQYSGSRKPSSGAPARKPSNTPMSGEARPYT